MKIKSSELEKIAVKTDQYPQDSLAEIALAGRSNVGKSSFINSFLNRKKLAYTSSKPGKTRTLNFYRVNNLFRFVDLPGYGYAKASGKELDKWADIINTYLASRENLVEVFQVVDIRHKPTAQDVQMYDWIISSGFKGYVIATKADKISRNKRAKHIKLIEQSLNLPSKELILPYSSEKKEGIDAAHKLVQGILNIEE